MPYRHIEDECWYCKNYSFQYKSMTTLNSNFSQLWILIQVQKENDSVLTLLNEIDLLLAIILKY